MRTFIAIDFDKEIKDMISSHIQKWDTGEKNIRWIKTQGMHLTLKFFGEIDGEKIEKVKSMLGNITKDYRPFRLSLKGTGSFPPGAKHPRVIWIGIEMNETLQNIQTRLENELHKLGFPREKRKFHPHLTLGRIKEPQNIGRVLESLDRHKETDFGGMTVDTITLFESKLRPTGAEYTILSEFYLE